MSVFEHRSFDQHEQVAFHCDKASGLQAIVAIHNTNLGVAMGGCRMYPYASSEEALNDVLRLSRGMTYKSAAANLPLGGGKSVIIGNPKQDKTQQLLHAMGRFVDEFGGKYIAAEDSGISEGDIKTMAAQTRHVVGYSHEVGRSGDPSPATAFGVFTGIQASLPFVDRDCHIADLRVAIQGLGNVGFELARLLHNAGAQLLVCDIDESRVQQAVQQFGAEAVAADEVFTQAVDVVAPCAMGAVIDDVVINGLQAKLIAGSANNQLAYDDLGAALKARGILYAPDYVINSGGIIEVYYQTQGLDKSAATSHITKTIRTTLNEVFKKSQATGLSTNTIADTVARARFDPDFSPLDHAA